MSSSEEPKMGRLDTEALRDVLPLVVSYVLTEWDNNWLVSAVDRWFKEATIRAMSERCVEMMDEGFREKMIIDDPEMGARAYRRTRGFQSLEPRILSQNSKPSPRFAHSVVVDNRGSVIVFGGRHDDRCFNDCWSLDPKTCQWTELKTTGSRPSPRRAHAAVYFPASDEMVIIGGGTPGQDTFGDVFALDLASKTWRTVESPLDEEWTSFGHVLVDLNEQEVLIHGGATHNPTTGIFTALDDVHILDLRDSRLRSVVHDGDPPSPRYRHSCTRIGAWRFLLFGGYVLHPYQTYNLETQRYRLTYSSADLILLDVSTTTTGYRLQWTTVVTTAPSKDFLPPRGGHAAVPLANGAGILILGGGTQYTSFPPDPDDPVEIDFNDLWYLETNAFTARSLAVTLPSPRGGVAAVLAPVLDSVGLLLFGGRNYYHLGHSHQGRDDLLLFPLSSASPASEESSDEMTVV